MTERQQNWNGSKWCRPSTRLAIYLRDGMACVYCSDSLEDGVQFQLDHVVPHSKGGSNDPSNLVTACSRCNASRGNRSVSKFARAVADYLNGGVQADDIVRHVRNCRNRQLPREEARSILTRRGTVRNALLNGTN